MDKATFLFAQLFTGNNWILDGCQHAEKHIVSNGLMFAYFIIAAFSMTGSVFVALTIFYNKKLRAHPSPLIAYICLAEGLSCYNGLIWTISSEYFSCYLGTHYLFSWTALYSSSTEVREYTLNMLCYTNEITFQFFQILSLLFNMCLCIDLVLTLMNPFYPSKRRMKYYLLGSVISTIILVIVMAINQGGIKGKFKNFKINTQIDACIKFSNFEQVYEQNQKNSMILALLLSIYIIIALYSCIYALLKLSKPGVSKQIRWMFLYKHFSYVAAFIIIWTLFLASSYYHLFNPLTKKKTPVDTASSIATFGSGLVLTIIRIHEPYFKFLMKSKIYEYFGVLISEEEVLRSKKFSNDTLTTFLTSSLNIEMVNIILQGINRFSENPITSDGVDQVKKNIDQYKVYRICKLNKIIIENPHQWEVGKVEITKPTKLKQQTTNQNLDHFDQEFGATRLSHTMTRLVITKDIQIYEYGPLIFQKIREQDNITNEQIRKSLHPNLNREQVFKAGESQGKSGSFFFFSHDKQFIIKTMIQSELKAFLGFFQNYEKQLKHNQNSLLARIYGIFTVKLEDLMPVNLILMGNTIQIDNSNNIEHIFDLKGSKFNREVQIDKNTKNTYTLKDNNLLKLCKEKIFLRFQKKDRRVLSQVIQEDLKFLTEHKLMDYSLLLAIEKVNPHKILQKAKSDQEIINNDYSKKQIGEESKTQKYFNDEIMFLPRNKSSINQVKQKQELDEKSLDIFNQVKQEFKQTRHKFISANGKFIYHIAIIDYLQRFDSGKYWECKVKTTLLGRQYSEISAIDPEPYAKRFYQFMREKVLIDSKQNLEDMRRSLLDSIKSNQY